MNLSQGLLLKNLILVGHRKDYRVKFNPGINIIYGDADTGKSSILRFVYYLLGGKQIKIDEEISLSVKYAVLEITINGKPYCISRDIFNAAKDIDVYSCEYSEISKSFPEKYKSNLSKGDDQNKSLSEFVLEALDLPSVSLKQAPTKDSSDTARLSLLDLFKFIYLDQDDVGSTHMFNIGNYVLETKNREVFKYIFNVLDSGISDIEADIARKAQEKARLLSEYATVSRFLSETQFKSTEDLDEEISSIEEIKIEMEGRLSDLNKRMTGNSELYEGLKDALNTINLNIEQKEEEKNKAIRNIERFSRLLNDYKNDINKIKSSLAAKEIIGGDIKENTSCPICETIIETGDILEKFDIHKDVRLKGELASIKRRSKDLEQLICDNRKDLDAVGLILDKLYLERNKAREIIDEDLSNSISPYLSERDSIVKELAQLDERREKAVHSLRVRNKQDVIADQIGSLEGTIEKLKIKLNELKVGAPSLDEVIKDISQDIDRFIRKVNIKNHHGVGIDHRTFFPKVRNIEYRKINSGGLRTIVSIAYLASILLQKLRKDTNIPGLLMVDTVGKFLGKTPEDSDDQRVNIEDDAEGVADPEKYRNLFNALVDVAEEFDEKGQLCQIILVDNDIPRDVAYENKGFEIAHYRSNGTNGLPIGLIDDWDSVDKI
jgi:hypothetical protein